MQPKGDENAGVVETSRDVLNEPHVTFIPTTRDVRFNLTGRKTFYITNCYFPLILIPPRGLGGLLF